MLLRSARRHRRRSAPAAEGERRGLRLLAAATAALCLAACSADSGTAGRETAKQAPASWPQPVDGKLTPRMCDLLTAADFQAAGVTVIEWKTRELTPIAGPNAIGCHALGSHHLSLNLQPDPVSATLYYQWMLEQHRKAGKGGTVQENGVPAAEASWFDVASTTSREHKIWARRGGLLVSMNLGFLHADRDYDPRKAAATLVSLVLERIPRVGTTATGKPHEIVLTVTGKNTDTATIIHGGPTAVETRQETNAKLPWVRKLQAPWLGSHPQPITLSGATTKVSLARPPMVSCTVAVDGKQIAATPASFSFASCNRTFTDRP